MPRTKSLSKQIRQAREGKGFTVAQLADRLGVSQVSIYYWESGRVRPRDTNLAALTKALKMPARETMVTIGPQSTHDNTRVQPVHISAISSGDSATTMRATDLAPINQPDQRKAKSSSVTDLDALLARLDKGISAEHTAMDNLLKRITCSAPEL